MDKSVSVIICVKNRNKYIKNTLESLSNIRGIKEIIVIDGGSTDGTIETARRYTKRVYYDGGKGLAYARQMGAILARSDYIAYIDSDVIIRDVDFFLKLIIELQKRGWIAIHAKLISEEVNIKSYWEKLVDFAFNIGFNKGGERKYIGTIACVVKRELLLEIRFDPNFKGAAEDHDLWERVRSRGYRFGISSDTVAIHNHRSTFRDFVRQRIWYGKGNVMFFIKHHNLKRLLDPLSVIIWGIASSLYHKKFIFIPGFVIWGISLALGQIIGIIDIILFRIFRHYP